MIVIGLTGSIGMGKSTTAEMFRAEGVPVHDSDAAVHGLYRGAAVPLIAGQFPEAIVDGVVDRTILSREVLGRPERLKRLESLIHPLVAESRRDFVLACARKTALACVVDIPLLLESGAEDMVDLIAVCSAPDDVQQARVLARPGMTMDKFNAIRARQVSNSEKRRRAHVIIDTGGGFDYARRQVQSLIRALAASG